MGDVIQKDPVPEEGALWKRIETGRVFKIRYADKERVFAVGIMEMWKGRPKLFMELFEEVIP